MLKITLLAIIAFSPLVTLAQATTAPQYLVNTGLFLYANKLCGSVLPNADLEVLTSVFAASAVSPDMPGLAETDENLLAILRSPTQAQRDLVNQEQQEYLRISALASERFDSVGLTDLCGDSFNENAKVYVTELKATLAAQKAKRLNDLMAKFKCQPLKGCKK